MRKAVYAGSFDPPTNGHLWMIEKGAEMFDELVLAVGINPKKKGMFTVEERLEMLKAIQKGHRNVRLASFENEFLVRYARSIGAKYILRGIRSYKDYEYEDGIRQVNEDIDRDVLTVFLMPPSEVANISSSLVKSMVGPRGWENEVKRYVPDYVYKELLKKFGKG
jgi:pantetheine-phosphate adenylyltransferase